MTDPSIFRQAADEIISTRPDRSKPKMTEWRELKTLQDVAEAQANGDEIEVRNSTSDWQHWIPTGWASSWKYRARSKPKVKQVKLWGWMFKDGGLAWRKEGIEIDGWDRAPSEDKVIEVEE